MSLFAFISALSLGALAVAQQTWNTPAWALLLVVLAFLVQGVWLLVKTIIGAMNAKATEAREADERARKAEDHLVLAEIRVVARDVAEMKERMRNGDKKFGELDDRLKNVEKDVHDLRMMRGGTGA